MDAFANIQQIIVKKMITDVHWLVPEWYNKIMDSYNFSLIFKYNEMPLALNNSTPFDITVWSSTTFGDKQIYPRSLGLIVASVYSYLHPVALYASYKEMPESKTVPYIIRFGTEIFDNLHLLAAQKMDFVKYTLESLRYSCYSSQARMLEIGEEAWDVYHNGTSIMAKSAIPIEFYNTVINLSLFCWLMTTNHEVLQYAKDVLQQMPLNRTNLFVPLLEKGKKIWQSKKTSVNKSC